MLHFSSAAILTFVEIGSLSPTCVHSTLNSKSVCCLYFSHTKDYMSSERLCNTEYLFFILNPLYTQTGIDLLA